MREPRTLGPGAGPMTSKERMLTAMRNGRADRVPVAPDISNMIPCRLTGKPFWDIYLYDDPPWWQAYIQAAKHFGIDGWLFNGSFDFRLKTPIPREQKIEKHADRWCVRTVTHTPDGDLEDLTVFPNNNSGTLVEKPVKDFEKDLRRPAS